jgi:hypothetical protein
MFVAVWATENVAVVPEMVMVGEPVLWSEVSWPTE